MEKETSAASRGQWWSGDLRLYAPATYPHADGVLTAAGEQLTVFNIGGNKYRLIARIRYDYQLVNIRVVLTHAEYDRGKWKE